MSGVAAVRHRRWAVGLGSVVLAAASAAGLMAGGSAEDAVAPRTVAGNGVALTVPADWQIRTAAVSGLELRGALAAGPPTPRGASVVAGSVAPKGPQLLPDASLRRLRRGPRRVPVRLGRHEAYRYADRGGVNRRLTVYAVPTTAGTTVVACDAPGGADASFMAACERVAATLRPTGRRPYPLGPDRRYLARVHAAFATLQRSRSSARRRLARVDGRRAQASWIARLESAYGLAIRRLSVAPRRREAARAHAGLVDALRETQLAYRRLRRAALRGRPELYERAGRLVARRERELDAALQAATGG